MDHVARPDHVQEVLRVVGMGWIFHRIQVIEIAKELIEAMNSRQKLIQIAQVVLAELTGLIALSFERGSNGASLCRYSHLGTRLADRSHACTNRKLTHDEVRATRRATGLGIIVGEQHSLLSHLVEVGCPTCHHTAM